MIFSFSHRKKRMKQLQKKIKMGKIDVKEDDPFELFISATDIRYCYYADTHKILGNTYGMCILQVKMWELTNVLFVMMSGARTMTIMWEKQHQVYVKMDVTGSGSRIWGSFSHKKEGILCLTICFRVSFQAYPILNKALFHVRPLHVCKGRSCFFVFKDFEALTPNLLARSIETVEGGGVILVLLRSLKSLRQLYTMTMVSIWNVCLIFTCFPPGFISMKLF